MLIPDTGGPILDSGLLDLGPCLDCTLKHLGAAAVLLGEDYPQSLVLAIGHLHEAARECPDLAVARRLRLVRKEVTAQILESVAVDCVPLILTLAARLLDSQNNENGRDSQSLNGSETGRE